MAKAEYHSPMHWCEVKQFGRRLLSGLGTQLCQVSICLAGPPLVIDDPGILDPGDWQFILATAAEIREDVRVHQHPILDVEYGVSDNVQLSFFLPRRVEFVENSARKSGIGYAAVGFKWRFWSSEKMEWALGSGYAFPASHAVIEKDGPDDVNVLALPLLVSRTLGSWTLNGQLAWNLASNGEKDWNYGLALIHPMTASVDWMVEAYGDTNARFANHRLNYQLGIDYAIRPAIHLLGSFGGPLVRGPEEPGDKLKYTFYIGLEWYP